MIVLDRLRRSITKQPLVWAIATAAAAGGAVSGAAPTGEPLADALMTGGAAAALTVAGLHAAWWTWLVAAAGAAALAGGPAAMALGIGGVAVTIPAAGYRPHPALGAAAGALTAQALLRMVDLGFHGASSLVACGLAAPLLLSGYRRAAGSTQRGLRAALLVSAGALGLATLAFGAATIGSRSSLETGVAELQQGIRAARQGDDRLAADHLDAAVEAFTRADRALRWGGAPARLVPAVAYNARATQRLAHSALDLAREGARAATGTDLESLKLRDGRLDLDRVKALRAPLADVAATLERAEHDVTDADEPWLVRPVADRLRRMGAELAAATPDARLATEAVELLPGMLGADHPTRWFVAFVTPVETRGRTGFLGNYAELTISDGRVTMTRFGRAQDLESAGTPGPQRRLLGPPDYVRRWGRFSPAAVWRHVTMSPDFPSVAEVITTLYPQSGGRRLDGVLAIDPVGLAALLRFTGPITVPGVARPLDADNAAQFLLFDQYVQLPDSPARIDVLETLARTTFERLTSADLPGPRVLADALGPAVRGGHLHLYGVDEAHQSLFERLGVDGALPAVDGDFLAVVDNNATGSKIDLFLERRLDYAVHWDPATGALDATATVTLRNHAPTTGLPTYVIGSALPAHEIPPGTNRTHLSVYTPWDVTAARLDGRPAQIEPGRERGRRAYSLFLEIPPGGERILTLRLQGHLSREQGYRLEVAAQPLVKPERLGLSVDVAGRRPLDAASPLRLHGRRAVAATTLDATTSTFTVDVGRDESRSE